MEFVSGSYTAISSSLFKFQIFKVRAMSDESLLNSNHYVSKCGLSSSMNIPDFTSAVVSRGNPGYALFTGGMKYVWNGSACEYHFVFTYYQNLFNTLWYQGKITDSIPNWNELVYSGTIVN